MAVYRWLSYGWILMSLLAGAKINSESTGQQRQNLEMCQVYNGNQCRTILNSTGSRFINTTLGFNRTEGVVVELIKQVSNVFESSSAERRSRCEELAKQVVCFYLFPPCSNDGRKVDYCREDCVYLFEICGDELNKLVGAGKAVLAGKTSGIIFRFDECDQDYKSKADYSGSNTTCQHLPFIELPTEMSKSKSNNTVVIVLCVVIPTLLLLAGFVFLYRRISRLKNRSNSFHYESEKGDSLRKNARLSNVVSMRDRIREWKVAPSELIELVDICKSRGVQNIPVDNIEYLKDLGSGQYGLVFQGKVNEDIEGETSRIVAVKTLREGSSEEAIKEFCQEVNIMSTFSHPHVVKLIGVSLAEEPYCMIFEFVEFGDLATFLRNCAEVEDESCSPYPELTVTDQLAMSLQVATGMKYISSIRCVHRDLAARNCLVGRGLVVKISDFGLSRDVCSSQYYRMDKTRMLPVRWLPPEAFTDGKFTTYSDVYSYGVLLWEIFTYAKLPYGDYDNSKTMELILEGRILEKPEKCPVPMYDIMKKCWAAKPEDRIPFADIINELCSLDDYGQRFECGEDERIEIYGRRIPNGIQNVSFQKESNSLRYSNEIVGFDEAPINIERLPNKSTASMEKNPSHYSTPMTHGDPLPNENNTNKTSYDGVITLPEAAGHNHSDRTIKGPQAVHSRTPPGDTGIPNQSYDDSDESHHMRPHRDMDRMSSRSQLITDDPEDLQETYDVPPATPERQLSKGIEINVDNEETEETYDVPPVPQRQQDSEEGEETYDIPPTSHASHSMSRHDPEGYDEGWQETYDVPPASHVPQVPLHIPHGHPEEPQETYDVPPAPEQRQLSHNEDDMGPQETYDVPPKHLEQSSDELYQNSPKLNSAHYAVPQSPYLQRRNQADMNASLDPNKSKTSSKRNSPYENVDFDGKPLIS